MHKYFIFLLFFLSCGEPAQIADVRDKSPAIVKVDQLTDRYTNSSDTTYVINFWATWCAPCVAELPYFSMLDSFYADKKVRVILVSMDFLNDTSKLERFVKKKDIRSEVMLLDETKPNEFIDKIDSRWNGSIPATMIINNSRNHKSFYEEEVTYEFLEEKVKALLN